MRILTKAGALTDGTSIDELARALSRRLPIVGSSYAIPPDSGRTTALAKTLSQETGSLLEEFGLRLMG